MPDRPNTSQPESQARRDLGRVLSGTALGFAGILLTIGAEKLLPSSIQQELIALVGLLLLGAGAVQALRGYLALSLLRLARFINDRQR